MEDHINRLLAEHGIAVEYKPGASARAYRKSRRIVLRPIKGNVTYFTALHELGHILGPNPPRRLEQEVAAWRWALDNAEKKPTKGVWKCIARCLGGYVDRADRWANMKLPEEGHDFWKLLRLAQRRA